jgi:gliding motility-associated-like protein
MKYTLLFLSLIITGSVNAQFTCTISPHDTIVCYKDSIVYTAFISGTTGNISYQWQKNRADIPLGYDSIYRIDSVRTSDTGYYRCIAWNADNPAQRDTSSESHLQIHPKMNIDTLYRYNELGCPGTCKGQFLAHVSGGVPPYTYSWGGGHSQDTLVYNLCQGTYNFKVTDSIYCTLIKKYYVDVLRLPVIKVSVKTPDTLVIIDPTSLIDTTTITIYLTNPNITVSFPDSSAYHMTNWEWDFGDSTKLPNINPVNHTYQKTGKFYLNFNFTDQRGCDTTFNQEIDVKIAQLNIPTAFSPNGDRKNDTFEIKVKAPYEKIDYLQLYLSTELHIYDRWGRKVFHATNYKSGDWDGGRNPDGVYFYILQCNGEFETEVFKGSVTIIGRDFQAPN